MALKITVNSQNGVLYDGKLSRGLPYICKALGRPMPTKPYVNPRVAAESPPLKKEKHINHTYGLPGTGKQSFPMTSLIMHQPIFFSHDADIILLSWPKKLPTFLTAVLLFFLSFLLCLQYICTRRAATCRDRKKACAGQTSRVHTPTVLSY